MFGYLGFGVVVFVGGVFEGLMVVVIGFLDGYICDGV